MTVHAILLQFTPLTQQILARLLVVTRGIVKILYSVSTVCLSSCYSVSNTVLHSSTLVYSCAFSISLECATTTAGPMHIVYSVNHNSGACVFYYSVQVYKCTSVYSVVYI